MFKKYDSALPFTRESCNLKLLRQHILSRNLTINAINAF